MVKQTHLTIVNDMFYLLSRVVKQHNNKINKGVELLTARRGCSQRFQFAVNNSLV